MAAAGPGPGDAARGEASSIRRTGGLGGAGDDSLTRLLADAASPLEAGDAGTPWHAVLTPEDRARLVAAVRRRGGGLDVVIAADMVAAVLPESLASLVVGETSRRRLAERIAATLIEDPRSHARLQALLVALRATTDDHAGTPP